MGKYIIGIDQSTQGTKAILFDEQGIIVNKQSRNHAQLINEDGWVSHDLDEIYLNVNFVIKKLIETSAIEPSEIAGVGISSQRETATAWSRITGQPLCPAIVWQDARAVDICEDIEAQGYAEFVKETTGIELSPYFTAAKFAWMLSNIPVAKLALDLGELCFGTVDSWLLFQLTKGESYKTEYSNASRTQLLNLESLSWDPTLCDIFGIPLKALPEVCDSDSLFGYTDFDGLLEQKVPIHSMLGDSQAALFGQSCWNKGDVKATIGTGSSVMMNVGEKVTKSEQGLVTSIAWKIQGQVNYVLEGNINYAGAVVQWLVDDVQVLDNSKDAEYFAKQANQSDRTYLVPAFTGLGAPYWASKAQAIFVGMTRKTGKPEIVRAGLNSISYQIADILTIASQAIHKKARTLKVDGGVTGNTYLMQFQSDISDTVVEVPNVEEFSALGAASCAGIALGLYSKEMISNTISYIKYEPRIEEKVRKDQMEGWQKAVNISCSNVI